MTEDTEYSEFLKRKAITDPKTGFEPGEIHPILFPFQRDITRWALKRGRAALFEDCGLGKTLQQLEWAHHVCEHTKGKVLILAPLGVTRQTAKESRDLLGREITVCESDSDVREGINITNYEKLHKFDSLRFDGVVLDESSILKSLDGATRTQLIESFRRTPSKLACTATPSPNDYMELGNHAEFLGVMTHAEMLSMFFVHDGGETQKWRLKGHAEKEFWKWVCSWAVNIRKPSNLGYEDGGFILPELRINEVVVEGNCQSVGTLFPMPASSLDERRAARKGSISERCSAALDIISKSDEQFLIWCDRNDEQDELEKLLGDKCVSIRGSTKDSARLEKLDQWLTGKVQCFASKPSIFGFGLNLQVCHNVIYVGLSDSQESFYQSVRRVWRFGQKFAVNCWIITSDLEGAVVANVKRKERDAIAMYEEMVDHMKDINTEEIHGQSRERDDYKTESVVAGKFEMHLGDCVELSKGLQSESVDLSIFSPPFFSLYTYSNSDRDLGNSRDDTQFFGHFKFLVNELYRVTKPGRIVVFHCMNVPAMKSKDGYIGLKDFRGDLIRSFQSEGFIFHSEHCIWKDPLIEATRTKALGLMHKQLCKDSVMSRAGIPDYMIAMRKPGENTAPIAHPNGLDEFIGDNPPAGGVLSHEFWRRYASPVWMDIRQTRTLQKDSAREEKDEKHICPLALDAIDRALELWSNPGEVVLDPFTGIGSTGYCAIKKNRRFIGFELKESYFNQAKLNLRSVESVREQDLFENSL